MVFSTNRDYSTGSPGRHTLRNQGSDFLKYKKFSLRWAQLVVPYYLLYKKYKKYLVRLRLYNKVMSLAQNRSFLLGGGLLCDVSWNSFYVYPWSSGIRTPDLCPSVHTKENIVIRTLLDSCWLLVLGFMFGVVVFIFGFWARRGQRKALSFLWLDCKVFHMTYTHD